MKKYLITGIKSGLGKYLYDNLSDANGLDRNNFDSIKNDEYETIIHCAFNKAQNIDNIGDYYNYLEDNILLTQELLKLNYKQFIYISTIDVYSTTPNIYGLFKRFAESIVKKYSNIIILRPSMILGQDIKSNHVTKLKSNESSLSLNGNSTFNYILNSDILKFMELYSYRCPEGIIDFVSNGPAKLSDTHKELNSTTSLGNYTYDADYQWINPIYNIYEEFNKSSLDNLKQYING